MMFVVTLELNGRPPEEYGGLEIAIKSLGSWSNRVRGTWLVETRLNASQVRDLLKRELVVGKDRLFVARIVQNWAGMGMGDGFPEWLGRRDFDLPATAPGSPPAAAAPSPVRSRGT